MIATRVALAVFALPLVLAPAAARAAGPQIDFPGQYAPARPEWPFPAWPGGCARLGGNEKAACLESVAYDFGSLARFADADAALAPAAPSESRVVFLGDSITDMWSLPDLSGGFFPGKPYVNRGIGGQTTSQMLLRLRADVIDLKPRVVVILAGTNDIAGNSGPESLETIEGNLATMAELCRFHGIRVVLSSLLPVCDCKKDASGQVKVQTTSRPPAQVQALNRWIADYAQANGYVYIDYFSAFAGPDGLLNPELTTDGLHPNRAGYAVMAPLAEKAITAALASTR